MQARVRRPVLIFRKKDFLCDFRKTDSRPCKPSPTLHLVPARSRPKSPRRRRPHYRAPDSRPCTASPTAARNGRHISPRSGLARPRCSAAFAAATRLGTHSSNALSNVTPPAAAAQRALVKSRRRRAYPQQIVTTRLLYCLQDPFAQLSRLQRIRSHARLNYNTRTTAGRFEPGGTAAC